jgi:hypothetical protein
MTIKTPAHAERLLLRHNFHLINTAVATNTAHPGAQMERMIKVGVARQFVYPNPLDWFVLSRALPDQTQLVTIGADQGVAIHAQLSWGNTGHRRSFCQNMAVATIYAQVSGMLLVAVGDGLTGPIADIGAKRRTEIPDAADHGSATGDEYERSNQPEPVDPLGKYVRDGWFLCSDSCQTSSLPIHGGSGNGDNMAPICLTKCAGGTSGTGVFLIC